jgi:cytochrome c553
VNRVDSCSRISSAVTICPRCHSQDRSKKHAAQQAELIAKAFDR